MFREVFILVFVACYSVESASIGGNWLYLGHTCAGAINNTYGEVVYDKAGSFVAGVKLVHTGGFIACFSSTRSNWGCQYWSLMNYLGMMVTDDRNRVIYPASRLVRYAPHHRAFYELPGFYFNSPELVLSDFGNPTYLKPGDTLRIWFGEDLLDLTEADNHGSTCMKVYVYKL